MPWWVYFLIGVAVYPILVLLYVAIDHKLRQRRQRRFINLVRVLVDTDEITYISMDSSDKRAMAKLERQIRDEYDIPE